MRKTNPVPVGDRRRMSDGKNAWRKMTDEQRMAFLSWIIDEENCGLVEQMYFTSKGWRIHDGRAKTG